MTDPERVWELHVGVFCTTSQARDLADRIQHALGVELGEPVPWTLSRWPLDEREADATYPELVEQVLGERRRAS